MPPPSADLARIRRLSTVCALACVVLAVALPILGAGVWAFASADQLAAQGPGRLGAPDWIFPGGVQPWQRLGGGLVSTVPTLILSYGLIRARRGLAAFGRGDFFASGAGADLAAFAAAVFWVVVANLVQVPALSLAVTIANPPGHRELSLGVNSQQFIELVTAGILWVMAAALSRAATLARENEQFV